MLRHHLEPKYVQVAIQRWEDHTGRKAKKIGRREPVPLSEESTWWEVVGYPWPPEGSQGRVAFDEAQARLRERFMRSERD